MIIYTKCPICKNEQTPCKNISALNYFVQCKVCGDYYLSSTLFNSMSQVNDPPHPYLSSYLRRNFELENEIEQLTSDKIEEIEKNTVEYDINEQINKILEFISFKQEFKGGWVTFNQLTDYSLFYCKNPMEFNFILSKIIDNNYLELENKEKVGGNYIKDNVSNIAKVRLDVKGIERLYEMQKKNKESLQCFVAMSFDASRTEIFTKGIKPAVESKGYRAYRVDKDIKNNNKVDDKIIAEIKKSKFMVADFTGNSHNVYYEAGFAMGFNIPVIFTCKKDWNENDENNDDKKFEKAIKFDIRQYPFIVYENCEQLKQKLIDKIGALF